jgi:hypothetical protein
MENKFAKELSYDINSKGPKSRILPQKRVVIRSHQFVRRYRLCALSVRIQELPGKANDAGTLSFNFPTRTHALKYSNLSG